MEELEAATLKLNHTARLQELLSNINNSGVSSVVQELMDSVLTDDVIRINLYNISRYNIDKIHSYCQLLKQLGESEKYKNIVLNFCTKNLLKRKKDKPYSIFNMKFLHVLYLDNCMPWEDIFYFIKFYPPNDRLKAPLFEMFYFEIQEKEPEFFASTASTFFENIIDEWDHYKIVKQEKLFKEYITYGYPAKSLEYCLKYDDILNFQQLTNGNNFDWNQYTQLSEFEPSGLNKQLKLWEFAAFFGAINCFKYMTLNKVVETNCIEYAVYGGNLEILRLVDTELWKNPAKLAYYALKLYKNDIFNWILENKITEKRRNSIEITIFEKACKYGNASVIMEYIDNGFTLNTELLVDVAKIIGEEADYFHVDRFDKS